MFRSRSRAKKAWKIFLILLLTGLVLFPLSAKEPLNAIAVPFTEIIKVPLTIVSLIEQTLEAGGKALQSLIDLHGKNQVLTDELARLKIEHNRLEELAAAAERYRTLFDFQQHCPYPTVVAQVIGRDPTNWHRSLVIAKGERDGVIAGMGVITPLGVVGRVLKVNRTFSVVQLILDRNNAITALVQRTRDEGIVQGVENGRAMMKYLPPLASVESGDVVVTSGLDDRFPKGMVIGIVNRVEKKTATPFKSATLTLHADFSTLEEVVVLLATTPLDGRDSECSMPHKDDGEGGA
ncbi:MAG TPA: rod shape-determining protein MreC [Nitrospirales bacterium]|nr:rod shape-determining protein MreC [Nitrospirales bacterium]HIO69306.1 rod shape-determining protein MreC [Nitrospirales bacterium]